MNVVAIVPARGGSKRITKKNIKLFAGKPIIAYPIQTAKDTELFSRIIVSTDDQEIAEVAMSYGAEAPFLRPAELSDDYTPTAPVLVHALQWLADQGEPADYFCCVYPTTPFLRTEYIKKGFEVLRAENAVTAFSVTTFPSPIFRALEIRENGYLQIVWSEYRDIRSQDLPVAYHDAGQFYWGNTEKFLEEKALYTQRSAPIILPRYLVHDIDVPEDWETAEKIFMAPGMDGK
jgi:pseudaminic acid cytidylyltransferase